MEENNLNVTGVPVNPDIANANNEQASQTEFVTPNIDNQSSPELITDNLVNMQNQSYNNPQQDNETVYPAVEQSADYMNSPEILVSDVQDNQINDTTTQQLINEQPVSEVIAPQSSIESNVSTSNDIKISGTSTEEEINNVTSGEKVEVLDEYEIKKTVNDEKLKNKKNNIYIATIFIVIIIFIILMPYILKMIGY